MQLELESVQFGKVPLNPEGQAQPAAVGVEAQPVGVGAAAIAVAEQVKFAPPFNPLQFQVQPGPPGPTLDATPGEQNPVVGWLGELAVAGPQTASAFTAAWQFLVAPPFDPVQFQFQTQFVLSSLTPVGVPELQRLADGATLVGVLVASPQDPSDCICAEQAWLLTLFSPKHCHV